MTQQTSDPEPQASATPCSRCGVEVAAQQMFQLADGRGLCRACRSIVLGARRQRKRQERAHRKAVAQGETTPTPRSIAPRHMPPPANDAAADVLFTGTATREGGAVDELVPCPECGAELLVYVPTCDACDADLSEYWEHDEFVHPPSKTRRMVRVLVRVAVIVGLLVIGILALPVERRPNYFNSILGERFVGPGRGMDDQVQGVEIHPTLMRQGAFLVIRNDDPFHWDAVQVSLNATRGRGGYKAEKLRRIWAGSTQEMPLANFRKSDAQQFLTEGMKIQTVTIQAETPSGKAFWSRPMDDITEKTTLEDG